MNAITKSKIKTSLSAKLLFLFFLSLFIANVKAQVSNVNTSKPETADCIDLSIINNDIACTTIYDPVCGCNGVTYPNSCVAKNHYGVTEWVNGPCNNCDLEVDVSEYEYTCDGANVCIIISGGQAPYTISLYNNNGTTTSSNDLEVCFNNLLPGNYEVVVVDATGCSSTLFFNIPVIDYFLEANVDDVSCFGGHDGAVDLHIPIDIPLNFEWLGPNGFTADSEDIENLFAGSYHVVITFLDGTCYAAGTFEVGQPAELEAKFVFTGSQCDDQVDGCLIVEGGTQPYHVWVFTCLDPNNTGDVPNPVFDDNGNVTIDGMTETDTMSLDDAGNPYERCAENIPAGTYYVLVADANLCWTFLVVEIPETEGLTAEFEITSDICADQVDGCLTVSGGTAPYQVFVWQLPQPFPTDPNVDITPNGPTIEGVAPTNDFDFANDGTVDDYIRCAENIPAGTYLVLVVDANGCYTLLTVEISEANPLTAEFIITSDVCDGQVDGCLIIEGGTQPYNIHVFTCPDPTPITDLPDPTIDANGNVTVDGMTPTDAVDIDPNGFYGNEICVEDIPAGIYYVIIDGANGCWTYLVVEIPDLESLTAEFEITSDPCNPEIDGCLHINGGTEPYRLWVFTCPNPLPYFPIPDFTNDTPVVDGMVLNTDFQFIATSVTGDVICANNIPPGTYYVLIADENNCWIFVTIVIEPSAGFEVEGEVTHESCAGNDGAIDLTVTGTGPFYFQWSNGETTEDLEGLSAGEYTVQVYTDNDFCTATATFLVEDHSMLELNFTFDPYGSFACVDPVGGEEPYTVEWIDLGTGLPIIDLNVFCVQGLEPGAYMVIVTDVNGCEGSEIFFIDEMICKGGEAVVDPSEIWSGENTNFLLFNYYGVSIQWQFKTEITDWLDIPGATSDHYATPPINVGEDKEIWVRAQVTCANGDVLYSTEALLYVFGNDDISPDEVAADRDLFNTPAEKVEFTAELSEAFPTITKDFVNVRFKANLDDPTTISLMDMSGRIYTATTLENVNEGQVKKMSLGDLTNGMYFIRVENKSNIMTHKVFVDKH